jgi:hypothetical protein
LVDETQYKKRHGGLKWVLLALALLAAFVWCATGGRSANAAEGGEKLVWGGGPKEQSSYSAKIVPAVIEQLDQVRLAGYEWSGPSQGTVMNAEMVSLNPTNLALGQGDLLPDLLGQQIPGQPDGTVYAFTIVQPDIGNECLYLVTESPHYQTLGHFLGNAWAVSVATGNEGSGSYGTFKRLQTTYPELYDVEVKTSAAPAMSRRPSSTARQRSDSSSCGRTRRVRFLK